MLQPKASSCSITLFLAYIEWMSMHTYNQPQWLGAANEECIMMVMTCS